MLNTGRYIIHNSRRYCTGHDIETIIDKNCPSTIYYKVLNDDFIHNDMRYYRGENILNKPFEKSGSCVPGGLYFTTIEHVHNFFDYGTQIARVYIDPSAEMIQYPDKNKYRADKITLGVKYSLLNPKTFAKLNIINNMPYQLLCEKLADNTIDIKWLHKHNYDFSLFDYIPRNLIEKKLSGDNPEFLQQLADIDYKFYNITIHDVVTLAVINGYINILNWCKSMGYKILCNQFVINQICMNGNVALLEWFDDNNIEIEYQHTDIDLAAAKGNLNILQWFDNSGYEFKHTYQSMDQAAGAGHLHILNWFHKSYYKPCYSERAFILAIENGHLNVLEWFYSYNYQITNNFDLYNTAIENGNVDILNWLSDTGFKFAYASSYLNTAVISGYVDILDWFKKRNYKITLSMHTVALTIANDHISILEWLYNNTDVFYHDTRLKKLAYKYGNPAVLDQWYKPSCGFKFDPKGLMAVPKKSKMWFEDKYIKY